MEIFYSLLQLYYRYFIVLKLNLHFFIYSEDVKIDNYQSFSLSKFYTVNLSTQQTDYKA